MKSNLRREEAKDFIAGGKIELFLDQNDNYLISASLPKGRIASFALRHAIVTTGVLPKGVTHEGGQLETSGLQGIDPLLKIGVSNTFSVLYPETAWNKNLDGDRKTKAKATFEKLSQALAGVSGAIVEDNKDGPALRIKTTLPSSSKSP